VKIQPGGDGYCDLGSAITPIDVATDVNRSMGDVHPHGNPHFNLSPKSLVESADLVKDLLVFHFKNEKEAIEQRYMGFKKEMDKLEQEIHQKLKEFRDGNNLAMEYHKEFGYFFANYGLHSFGPIEEIPGVLPSAARLVDVASRAKKASVRVALAGLATPQKHLDKFSKLSGIPYYRLPTMVQNDAVDTISKLQHLIADTVKGSVNGNYSETR
jgi:zinc/manganese transport system substrate-binding protein